MERVGLQRAKQSFRARDKQDEGKTVGRQVAELKQNRTEQAEQDWLLCQSSLMMNWQRNMDGIRKQMNQEKDRSQSDTDT